jgi:hypothetical protein
MLLRVDNHFVSPEVESKLRRRFGFLSDSLYCNVLCLHHIYYYSCCVVLSAGGFYFFYTFNN